MKTLSDLMNLVTKAIEENNNPNTSRNWFVNYSGHVKQITVDFYFTGWSNDSNNKQSISQYLNTENDIQAVYYFIATRLLK